jgi:hypothetical protein
VTPLERPAASSSVEKCLTRERSRVISGIAGSTPSANTGAEC